MNTLNQVVAIEKGVKARSHQRVTEAYQTLDKAPLLAGQTRTYQPHQEDGQSYPPESQRVQVTATNLIAQARRSLVELFDVTATKDWANCTAKADVVVDGHTLLTDVPATYLLFLEKQLVDLHTFVAHLPVLDPSEDWTLDPNTGVYKTGVVETYRTQKVMRNHVLAEATDKHPAQVSVYTEDVPVGTWSTIRFSGALPATRVQELSDRVERVQQAVKMAREAANTTDAPTREIGETVLGYLFG